MVVWLVLPQARYETHKIAPRTRRVIEKLILASFEELASNRMRNSPKDNDRLYEHIYIYIFLKIILYEHIEKYIFRTNPNKATGHYLPIWKIVGVFLKQTHFLSMDIWFYCKKVLWRLLCKKYLWPHSLAFMAPRLPWMQLLSSF